MKSPIDGAWLYPTMLHVIDRDAQGRPTTVRVAYEDETVGEVIGERAGKGEKHDMLLVWMTEHQTKAMS